MAADPNKASEVVGALGAAVEKNEHGVVIEFVTDRVLHYVGVYLVAFLAAVAKITQLATASLSCYPTDDSSATSNFITYANNYCWESSNVTINNHNSSCGSESSALNFINDPSTHKAIFRALPYAMLLEALLYALPSIFWHGSVGAKAMGHMKFMRNLLTDIYECVKLIPKGNYESNSSYDSRSYYLNGWNGFKPEYKSNSATSSVRSRRSTDDAERNTLLTGSSNSQHTDGVDKTSCGWMNLWGDMKDRHLFSMLCFENFSSLEHHPYILSVYKLSQAADEDPNDGGNYPKLKAMLRLICNENNFGGRFLVKAYFCRHAIGSLVSLIAICAMFTLLIWIQADGWYAESFRCGIPYHVNTCMICTILRRMDMIAYIFFNLFISIMYFVVSISRLLFLRRSTKRAICHYFEEISATGSVALD